MSDRDLRSPREVEDNVYSMEGNESLLLDDPEILWVVQSGALALFAGRVKGDRLEGAGRCLCSAAPGDALFGTTPHQNHELLEMFVVAIEKTKLLRVSTEQFGQLVSKDAVGAAALVDNWVLKLASAFPEVDSSVLHVPLAPNEQLSLSQGQRVQPRSGIVWVRIRQGKARWMNTSKIFADPAILPLGPRIWLEAEGPLEITGAMTNETVQDPVALFRSLAAFHQYYLYFVNLLEGQEREERTRRLQERERQHSQATEKAVADLVDVVEPQRQMIASVQGTPLLVAAAAVGQALGIKISPPSGSATSSEISDAIKAIERASRIRIRRILLSEHWWESDCGPLLAFRREDSRPVALLPLSPRRYESLDPITMTRTPLTAAAAATLSPFAYTFYRPFAERSLNALDVLHFGLKGQRRTLTGILLAGGAATLLGMITPVAMGLLIDTAIPDSNRGLLSQLGLALLAAAVGRAVFELVQGIATLRLETFSSYSTEAAVWDRLLRLRPSFFRKFSTGDLLSRAGVITAIRERLSSTTLTTLFISFISLANLALMLYYNARLAVPAVLAALFVAGVTVFLGSATLRKLRPLQELQGKLLGLCVQLINGVSKIRVAGAEEFAFAFWGNKFSEQQRLNLEIQWIRDQAQIVSQVLPPLTSGLLFWLAALAILPTAGVQGKGMTVGDFLAFSLAFGMFSGGTTSFCNTLLESLDILNLWERAKPILTAELEVDPKKTDPGRLSGQLAVEHVTFRYREAGPLTLDDISLQAEPGEFIALVGPSGGGKSTILRLLLGFESPESGTVYYDGQDLSGLDVSALRRQFGVVLQHSNILSAPIFENIAGGTRITLDEAWAAARDVGLADEISRMPMGMHTLISEGGTNLSGGQRQRILLARALVVKPRILLFDEATSALDNRTQAIVSQSVERLQITRVVIAHRLSTIRKANRIYVVHAGRVIQCGTYPELKQQGGFFTRLMARQIT